jgi:CubicO group peptidase (beta-lactamase class C family)
VGSTPAALDDPADFYGAMWWVDRQPGARRDPFFARGKYGQMIAVVPDQDLVFVRLGSHDAGVDWQEFLLDLAARMPLAR